MPTKTEKIRTGPKAKSDKEKARPVAFYVSFEDVEDFGGIDEARTFAKNAFEKELNKRRK